MLTFSFNKQHTALDIFRLRLDVRNLSPERRHLVNAYKVKAGISVIAGNTVLTMPERLESEVLHEVRYINTLYKFIW